ncbi:signal recognition particle-docking protein FtsY [Halapricum hydrolyticum]|uniref:Signal recognition particle receptor FtsY n=1 Tax=Halapricum hydrolyticum TaxID=2979991 RepID=A0AAE3I941_9EURY|nr:signal recognition particle-docking protein FtsY [Halapricum hydrolyticum]MCU4717184.1 signal recognition particle-docking protein FtsY [Halapricum hydrolyticum]MCU4726111.1 signal recognition particle-docking protein FtsY [Halapricum hydrolyticum]
MFDGLKEKLGRFSSDVEEDVDEEAVEEVDEAAADGEVDEGADEAAVDGDAEPETASSPADAPPDPTSDPSKPEESPKEETRDGSPAETATRGASSAGRPDEAAGETDHGTVAADTSAGTAASPNEATAESAAGDESPADEDASSEDEPPADEDASDDDESSGRGLAERAKLFATGKTVIDEDDLQDHLDDLEIALLQSDVEMEVAQEILDGVKANLTGETRRRLESTGNLVRDALREALYDVISVGQFDFDQRIAEAEKPIVIIFTGVNGVGKTTSIAKLSHYLEQHGNSSVLANGDTYRAGANEQLREHAENLDRTFISHEQGSDPTAVIYDAVEYAEANDVDVVLGDTAGRLHTSDDLMAQLEKIDRVIEPDMTLFVDEAVAGQDAVNRAREFDDAAEIDGTILTKADADPQGGAAISIAHVTGKPILFLGTGQDYDDLERFDPEAIVDRLIEE